MRAVRRAALGRWGLIAMIGATIGTTGALGCGSRHPEGFTTATRAALPLGVYPASARMTQKYGIVEWRLFAGRSQLIITGYRADGSAARGVQLASYKAVPGTPAHVRLLMLDGTGTAVRRTVTGAKSGTLSPFQNELVETMRYDFQRAPGTPAGGALGGTASQGTGLRLAAAPAIGVTTGVHLADFPAGTSPGTGPQCTEAWNNPQIPIDGSGCILGAATFEDGVGGLIALATCGQWYTDMQAANATCSAEDSSSCNTDNPTTCNFNSGTPEAAAPAAPQSACDSACLCANYPDTAQGCNTNYGPCTSNYDCSGGYTCQAGQPGASSTCQAPQADAGAASGDDAGASSGDDGGSSGGGDDGGGASGDPPGDDGGGGDPTGDPSGDDGGAGDPNAPPTEQQVDDSADNTNCPSCQGAGSDLSANPQNGDVAVTQPGSDPSSSGANPATSDTTDVPAGGSSSGGAGSGSSTGGSSSSTSSSSGGDDGTGQASQDQSSQDQSSQDQSSQDQSSQDQSSQDQPSQDQGSQDPAQDAQDAWAARKHRHHHKPSGWRRLYDRIAGWLGN